MTERAPLGPLRALQEQNRVNRVGGARQLVANASPLPSRKSAVGEALAALAAISDISFMNDDIYTLTAAGAQTKTLTYPPIAGSLHVELNGLKAKKGVDWTLSGNVLSLLTALDARVGDVLTTEYAYYTGVPSTPSEELPDSVLYLPLGEASGSTAADASGFGHDGTYFGTPGYHATSLRADGAGYGVTFSGDDYVDVSWGSWMDTAQITVEGFIKTSMTSKGIIASRDMIGAGWRVWQFAVDATGKLQFVIISGGGPTVTSPSTINDGTKHHVAAVVGTADVRLYVDGALVVTTAWTSGVATSLPSRFSVGTARSTSGDTPSELFVGVIDEIGYYTRALDASEIAILAAR